MRAGALDQTIVIQQYLSTANDVGTPVMTWSTFATVRARIVQGNSVETIRPSGANDETVIVFNIRHLDGVTNADRVSHAGRLLNIKEVVPIGRRKAMDLRCVAMGGN